MGSEVADVAARNVPPRFHEHASRGRGRLEQSLGCGHGELAAIDGDRLPVRTALKLHGPLQHAQFGGILVSPEDKLALEDARLALGRDDYYRRALGVSGDEAIDSAGLEGKGLPLRVVAQL